jgi:hypothetical protein
VTILPIIVLTGWLYDRSKGSIRVAGVAHTAVIAVRASMPGPDWPIIRATLYAAALVMVLPDRMRKKLPSGDPAREPNSNPLLMAVGPAVRAARRRADGQALLP